MGHYTCDNKVGYYFNHVQCRHEKIKAEVRSSFITTTVREQRPMSQHKGATDRVPTGDQRYPVLCHCQLGQICYIWSCCAVVAPGVQKQTDRAKKSATMVTMHSHCRYACSLWKLIWNFALWLLLYLPSYCSLRSESFYTFQWIALDHEKIWRSGQALFFYFCAVFTTSKIHKLTDHIVNVDAFWQ